MSLWTYQASRRELIDLLSGKRPLTGLAMAAFSQLATIDKIGKSSHLLIWSHEASDDVETPQMIVLPEGEIRDFLAWACTYLPDRTPVSSLFRICDEEQLRLISSSNQERGLGRLRSACAGAVIGEIITQSEGYLPSDITPKVVASTFGFSAARALELGYRYKSLPLLVRRWRSCAEVVDHRMQNLNQNREGGVWPLLFMMKESKGIAVEGPKYSMLRACRSLLANGTIDEQDWSELTGSDNRLESLRHQMAKTREERVVSLEQSLLHIRSSMMPEDSRSFIAGYLASLVGPGELSHYQLLQGALKELPEALLWYGVCAGLHARGGVERFGEGLGWRIIRDVGVHEELVAPPMGDISLDELEIVLTPHNPRRRFRTEAPGSIKVEVLPRVYGVFRWRTPEGASQHELFPRPSESRDSERIRLEIEEILFRLERIHGRLSGSRGNSSGRPVSPRKTRARKPER